MTLSDRGTGLRLSLCGVAAGEHNPAVGLEARILTAVEDADRDSSGGQLGGAAGYQYDYSAGSGKVWGTDTDGKTIIP